MLEHFIVFTAQSIYIGGKEYARKKSDAYLVEIIRNVNYV